MISFPHLPHVTLVLSSKLDDIVDDTQIIQVANYLRNRTFPSTQPRYGHSRQKIKALAILPPYAMSPYNMLAEPLPPPARPTDQRGAHVRDTEPRL